MTGASPLERGTTIFTIVASNYLAQASVLGASVSAHYHGAKLVVFLLDALPPALSVPDHLVIVPAEQAFERQEWNHRRAHYDILEFATSVKPACFRLLFERGARRAIYLDPDIRLFQRVDPFWCGEESDPALILTPHILTPLPNDGRKPDDLVILRAGLYNLGFAAMRDTPDARALLDWWDAKLHHLCLRDIREGVFTDQKWMDFAPLLVRGTVVLDHPGFNVAYWNLHERIPRHVGGQWQVEVKGKTQELVFFHFSGFSPGQPDISQHENRYGKRPPGDARRLYDDYAVALTQAGAPTYGAIDAPRAVFDDGTAFDMACRALYRQAIAQGLTFGDPLGDPAFIGWAAGIAPGDRVTRYARAVMKLRGDIAAAYQDGLDIAGLLAWMRSSGVAEMGLDTGLIERLAAGGVSATTSVNYVGYLRAHLGIGEAARQSIAALDAAGVLVRTHDISADAHAPVGDYQTTGSQKHAAAITILGCNADVLPQVLDNLPSDLRGDYRIGCWYWETPDFPEQWTNRFDLVDEIWVATRFVADAIRAKATVPVVVMPPMVQPPRELRDRRWLLTLLPDISDEEFVFLYQFDAASVPFRKNPEGVVEAFRQAFSPDEPVRLVLKLLNGHAEPDLMVKLHAAAAGQRMSMLDRALENDDRLRLVASADCFVSLHRSEGLGLSIAEAMAYGLPVVVTGWSGNADFTHADNAAIVPYDLVPGAQAHGPYPAGTQWAEPKLDVAATLMRRVWTDKRWREAMAQAGAATIAQRYSAGAAGTAMRERILRIQRSARFQTRREATPVSHRPPRSARLGITTRFLRPSLRIASDVLRFPGFYLSRLPLVPGLLRRTGLRQTLMVGEEVATGPSDIKLQYSLRATLGRWAGRLGRGRDDRQTRR